MRYYLAIFGAAIFLTAGGAYWFFINPIATHIPDYSISAHSPSALNQDNNIQPHRGSGR